MKLKLYFLFFLTMCQQVFAQSDYYWVGGTGSWSDLNHWRIGSSTGPQATIIPSRYDNVLITNLSGFTSSMGSIAGTAICKDFIVQDGFTGNFRLTTGISIYGNVQWRKGAYLSENTGMTLMYDNTQITPNLIDIPSDIYWINNSSYDDYGGWGYTKSAYVYLTGNGKWKLINDLGGDHFDMALTIQDNASLDTNGKNIMVKNFNYTSSTISDFGNIVINTTFANINDKVNLSNSTIDNTTHSYYSNYNINSPGLTFTKQQTVKKITSSSNMYKPVISSTIGVLNVDEMVMNSNATFSGLISVNNLNLNNLIYSLDNTNINYYLQINQSFTANVSCKGISPSLGISNNGYIYKGKIIAPKGVAMDFPNYTFTNINAGGGANYTAATDGGGNIGNITYNNYTSHTYYWIGGAGNWFDPSHWSLTSGGTPANCVPMRWDDVFFDQNSGTGLIVSASNGHNAEFRDMKWLNVPGIPQWNVYTATSYGSVYLQKNMQINTTNTSFNFSGTSSSANYYISFEGNTMAYITVNGVGNYYLVAPNTAGDYHLKSIGAFNFSSNGAANLFADNSKISVQQMTLGGNSVSISNSDITATNITISSIQAINAQNTTARVGGVTVNSDTNNHFIDTIIFNGTGSVGVRGKISANTMQVVSGTDFLLNGYNTSNSTISTKSFIHNGTGGIIFGNYGYSPSFSVTDVFLFNRNACSSMQNMSGISSAQKGKLVLGSNVNGNGIVQLNRLNITNITASGATVLADNSIDNGNNTGITFTAPTGKNLYWVGGAGNWDDETHWSLVSGSTNPADRCGAPTIYDNVFFDANSGFAGYNNTIYLNSNVFVNDMTWTVPLPASGGVYMNTFSMNINGNLSLQSNFLVGGYYGDGYRNWSFINQGKPAGITKTVNTAGISGITSLNFTGYATWKITSTMKADLNLRQYTGATLDFTGITTEATAMSFAGEKLILNNSTINTRTIVVNTVQPIQDVNSVINITPAYYQYLASGFNALNHYIEKINITPTYQDNSSNPGYYATFSFPQGTINELNVLPYSATVAYTGPSFRTLQFGNLNKVNTLNISGKNTISLVSDIYVQQKMNLAGTCSSDKLAIVSSDATVKKIIIPSYNTTDFKISNTYLKNLSSSGGQTYEVSSSVDGGNNTGFNFNAIPAARDLYWIGGQGDFDDAQHWSLTSGGTPLTDCFPPRATDNVFFDANSGFTAAQNRIYFSASRSVKNMTFNNAPNKPILSFNGDTTYNYYRLYVYGNLVLQNDVVVSAPGYNILMVGSAGITRYIDTKGVSTLINIVSTQDDFFELQSDYYGGLTGTNVKSFKTNNYSLTTVSTSKFEFLYNSNINPILDFGQSVINSPTFTIDSYGNYPVTINASNSKITTGNFYVRVTNVNSFGDVNITGGGTLNSTTLVHNFNKVTFLGSGTLSSKGNYKTLYFNPGTYTIASGQTVTENLFMTGTSCNRINVSRTAASGQTIINLDPAAAYTIFYASVKDISFSRPVSAYGNSQDLGNTTNLTIVPTNVQAAGFGGNKTLCASEFPKTYDAAALYGTDPNASYTWTKIGAPNAGVISTSPMVTFTQPGNYSVKVVYAQDGCNITENFTISSVALPADNTSTAALNALQQPTGDVTVTFKGSLTNQIYIFTYNINNGADMEVTSNSSGVATIDHPRNIAGTFVYRLKSIRFASGMACPAIISNKNVVVYINPACTAPGVVQLYGTELRGCTTNMGARRLAEVLPVIISNPPVDENQARLIPGSGIVIKEGPDVFLLRNVSASPEILTGLPASKPHIQGAIIYHNDHFYEGVENGRWIRIDND
ncbi:hypothetical protein [Soonwooa sp.]|uniref:hypothetical protein n=1 Tax=Soonwooa sp. TaxID=1938592 RepID=UPI0035B140A7